MPLPERDTLITYPDGAVRSTGIVLHTEPMAEGRTAVLVDTTACHPVDTAWPDQPADRGTLATAAGALRIVDAVTGGIHDGRLHLGDDLPVRGGTDGWTFVVAHVIDGPPPEIGAVVDIHVDEDHRAALSAGHTACHLAALALDFALADAWTKPVATDSLGSPAFDSLAIQRSRIGEHRSTDLYRIGKSLRRKGFDASVLDDPDAIAATANEQLAAWVAAGGKVAIERDEPTLSARRAWACSLGRHEVRIPCGGTHLTDLDQLESVTVALVVGEVDGGRELTMTTRAVVR